MSNQGGFYRRSIPKLNLSIERNTNQVPNDGMFHIVREGKVIESFRVEKKAVERFRQLVEESGYKPEVVVAKTRSAAEEAIELHLYQKEIYWAESHKYRDRRGKGGRGGV